MDSSTKHRLRMTYFAETLKSVGAPENEFIGCSEDGGGKGEFFFGLQPLLRAKTDAQPGGSRGEEDLLANPKASATLLKACFSASAGTNSLRSQKNVCGAQSPLTLGKLSGKLLLMNVKHPK